MEWIAELNPQCAAHLCQASTSSIEALLSGKTLPGISTLSDAGVGMLQL
jgi:hypothetical protein|tara:strand:- start:2462 stop:2608 length:147 start_codon:yes stop_codon:yes gene_type:complete